ncbi:MAG: hypothetical protein WCE49_03335 [Terrimicrobiaceae bacterium]
MAGSRTERVNLTERIVEMYFENELTGTLTLIEFLLAVLVGLAPIAVTIWVKLLLYRRRVVEDEEVSPAWADHQPRGAAESAGGFSHDTVPPVSQGRQPRMVRKLPAAFDRSKPLGLFVMLHPAAERLNLKTEKEKTNETAIPTDGHRPFG